MNKIKFLKNMIIASILYPFTKKKFSNRKIWLVGGNAGELFVDNSRAMYEYLRAKNNIEEYWVLNEDSKVKDKIPGEVLIKGSVDSYLYFMNAEVALFSHSISADIVPYLFVVPTMKKFHNKVFKVFLNHGTVGFKVRKPMNPKVEKIAEKLVKSYDLNIADSEFEKNVKIKTWWNVDEKNTFITGYPRYDKLYNVEIEKKEILFMPTWRNWIKLENREIEKTDYFKNIVGLITNENLNKFLEIKNIKFKVYIHQLMHEYLDKFKSINVGNNIEVLSKETDITKELMKTNLLITDYSSVAYDYLYLNKPIIFFQFDKAEYEAKVGSYVDLDNDLFGENVYNVEKCVEKIVEIVNNNYKYNENIQEKITKLREKFLFYIDKENCKRVYNIIEKKLEEKGNKNG